MNYLNEARGVASIGSIEFEYSGKKLKFPLDSEKASFRKCYLEIYNWLFDNKYDFKNIKNVFNNNGLFYSKDEVDDIIKSGKYQRRLFQKLKNSDRYLLVAGNKSQYKENLINMLEDFGVEDEIKFEGFGPNDAKIKPFIDYIKGSDDDELYDDELYDDDKVDTYTSKFVSSKEKRETPKIYVKNPFGCKQKDGSETSALCVIGKSGSGKTTSTEIALESMEHEYLLYIPIEGEYTFSQYTGEGFEMSSLGEFMMMAQNNPSKCYTVIFDECHRPITISKLNTDLLQALSSKRNRGGDRFVTIDRSTKRMYTTPTEEFPIPLKEKSGKVLVPDNFGIVCLSSNPAVICRNDDFLNRVDLVVFHQSDREVQDLTKLKKLEPIEKNIESIRGLLLSDGKQEL